MSRGTHYSQMTDNEGSQQRSPGVDLKSDWTVGEVTYLQNGRQARK